MKTHCDIKFKDDVDGKIIRKLVGEHGFRYFSRNFGSWIIYRKSYLKSLDDNVKRSLINECNRLCEPFYGTTNVDKDAVADALITFAKGKVNPDHEAFIKEWVKNNIEDVANDCVPWS